MNREIQWFTWLCIQRGLLEPSACSELAKAADPDMPLLAFAEMMLESGFIRDLQRVQELLDEFVDSTEINPEVDPPYNPFVQSDDSSAPMDTEEPEAATEGGAAEAILAEAKPREEEVDVGDIQPGWPEFSQLESYPDATVRDVMVSLLLACSQSGISDLHISADARPFYRQQGNIYYLDETVVSPELSRRLNLGLLNDAQREYFLRLQDYDFALSFSSGDRYRVNLMRHKDGYAGTYRTVPHSVPTLEELGFQQADTIKKLLAYHNGLILVTGPLGSGKTTTLAAMVREINETRTDHIITVEEPIEIVLTSQRCQITQRGVGPHTRSFRSALKGALRQDPDIIVIGEMRDLETIEMAISASETGHLVIGTMHTSDASTTLNRLLDVFPPAQQPQIRAMVAESLRGIVCQRLFPGKEGGVVLAVELLLRNMAVSALIREGKTEGLVNVMETGKREGMQLMDAAIMDLWRTGYIADEVVLENVKNRLLHREVRG